SASSSGTPWPLRPSSRSLSSHTPTFFPPPSRISNPSVALACVAQPSSAVHCPRICVPSAYASRADAPPSCGTPFVEQRVEIDPSWRCCPTQASFWFEWGSSKKNRLIKPTTKSLNPQCAPIPPVASEPNRLPKPTPPLADFDPPPRKKLTAM